MYLNDSPFPLNAQLHFFTIEALQKFLDTRYSISKTAQALNLKDQLEGNKLEGFTIEQWAHLARKKASIASAVTKLNGALKSALARSSQTSEKTSRDIIFNTDHWKHTDLHRAAPLAPAVDPWSGWGLKLDGSSHAPPWQKCVIKPSEPKADDKLQDSVGTDVHCPADPLSSGAQPPNMKDAESQENTNTSALLPPSADASIEQIAAHLDSMGVGSCQNG